MRIAKPYLIPLAAVLCLLLFFSCTTTIEFPPPPPEKGESYCVYPATQEFARPAGY